MTRPVTALDYILIKDRNLALAPRQGPEINSRACLWVSPRPRRHTKRCSTNQRLILLHISCRETPKAGPLPARRRSHFLVLQHVQRPSTAHRMPGRDIIQRLLALLDPWGRC